MSDVPSMEEPLNPNRWIILVGLILAAVMEIIDTTIVNVSLPQMAGNLGATSEEIGWVSTGYILSNVVVLPLTAWLSSRFGRKRYLGGSILLFVIASFFCGTSGSLLSLVFWRVMQGAGGAALLSTAQATLREIFPLEQQGLVQSIYVMGIIAAPTLGPTLGGYITDNFGWHWLFFINVPIGMLAFFLVYNFLEDSKYAMASHMVDWIGILLLATGLGCLQYVLEEGNAKAWFDSPAIVWPFLVALVALPVFVWWQLSPLNELPVVNIRVMHNRDLSAALLMFFVLGFGLYGGVFIFPMFAQGIMHLTPTETGLVLLPGGLATGVMAIFCGRMLNGPNPRFDPRIAVFCGFSLVIASMVMLAFLPSNAGAGDAQAALVVRGFGLGMLFVPITVSAFSTLRGPEIAQGSGLMNLFRQLGGSLGIAFLASRITHNLATARTSLVNDVFAGNPALEQRIAQISNGLMAKGYSMQGAKQAAYAIVDRSLMAEASTISYNSGFLIIAFVTLMATPALFVLHRPKPKSLPGA